MHDRLIFGDLLDDTDRLFTSLHAVVFGIGAANLILRAGIAQRLLEGPATTGELAALGNVPQDKLSRVLDFLHGHAVLFDAHSIKSELPWLFDGTLPHMNLGTAGGQACDAGLTQQVVQVFAAQQAYSQRRQHQGMGQQFVQFLQPFLAKVGVGALQPAGHAQGRDQRHEQQHHHRAQGVVPPVVLGLAGAHGVQVLLEARRRGEKIRKPGVP